MWTHGARLSPLLVPLLITAFPLIGFAGAKTDDGIAVLPKDLLMAKEYLVQFGYLPPPSKDVASLQEGVVDSAFKSGIVDFQKFAGLPVTGQLDEDTLKMMKAPRCGVKDKDFNSGSTGNGTGIRTKRYILEGSRWRRRDLTFKVVNHPKKFKQADVQRVIQKAFDLWGQHTNLKFTPSHDADIVVGFAEGAHGDSEPFDGPKGVLAHAAYPIQGGAVHFDAAEDWSLTDDPSKVSLFQAAAHEIGHALGLGHSDVRGSIMEAIYKSYNPKFRLHKDDIKAIQALYGPKTPQKHKSQNASGGVSGAPDLCKDPKIDAVFTESSDGFPSTYILKGRFYWSLGPNVPENLGVIADNWKGLPADVEAAFGYKNGKTYFFKGAKYWRYHGTRMDGVYPKKISEGFPGIPENIDSVAVTGNVIYFFKGQQYWRFDPTKTNPVKKTYPKKAKLDGKMKQKYQWRSANDFVYFYRDQAYYKINESLYSVEDFQDVFPKFKDYFSFGCTGRLKSSFEEDPDEDVNYSSSEESQEEPEDDFFKSSSNEDSGIYRKFPIFSMNTRSRTPSIDRGYPVSRKSIPDDNFDTPIIMRIPLDQDFTKSVFKDTISQPSRSRSDEVGTIYRRLPVFQKSGGPTASPATVNSRKDSRNFDEGPWILRIPVSSTDFSSRERTTDEQPLRIWRIRIKN